MGFVTDNLSVRTSVLRGRWCDIFVGKAQASSEDSSDDTKESIYRKIEHENYHFRKYLMKNLLGHFNEKLWREDYTSGKLEGQFT